MSRYRQPRGFSLYIFSFSAIRFSGGVAYRRFFNCLMSIQRQKQHQTSLSLSIFHYHEIITEQICWENSDESVTKYCFKRISPLSHCEVVLHKFPFECFLFLLTISALHINDSQTIFFSKSYLLKSTFLILCHTFYSFFIPSVSLFLFRIHTFSFFSSLFNLSRFVNSTFTSEQIKPTS